MTKMKFVKKLAALAVVAAGFSGAANATYLPFTVTETPYVTNYQVYPTYGNYTTTPSNIANSFTADDLNGHYYEKFSISPTSASTGTFATAAYFNLGNYVDMSTGGSSYLNVQTTVHHDAQTIPQFCNSPTPPFLPYQCGTQTIPAYNDVTSGYKIIGLFSTSGTYSVDAFGNETFKGGTTGNLSIYLTKDMSASGVLGANGTVAPSITSSIAPILLGSSSSPNSAMNGGHSAVSGTSYGDFSIEFTNFTLTNDGKALFTAPTNFYPVIDLKGQFNQNPLTNSVLDGSANAYFAATAAVAADNFGIPEPTTLALAGLSILAAGAAARRRKN